MRVLVIGGGGREHALVWRLSRTERQLELFACPGNPGIAALATCLPATQDFARLAREIRPDLTIVGPEAPLLAGIVDQFRAEGLAIVGPTAAAARLEGSKEFAKQIMTRAGVPTARYLVVEEEAQAISQLEAFGYPVVLKADGLAAGKGVVIAPDRASALTAIAPLLALSGRLVIEEHLSGEEVSVIALVDGRDFVCFPPAQDHKRIFRGDQGPNTGGMGAYSDQRLLTAAEWEIVQRQILGPTIAQMQEEGYAFTGFLYAGLMMTVDGPKVLEFNARFGDPEAQVLLPCLQSDPVELFLAASIGELCRLQPIWAEAPAVCVVLAAEGYPGAVKTGDEICGIDAAVKAGTFVFQAGTAGDDTKLVTAGGRVLGVTAIAATLPEAMRHAYRGVSEIRFRGMQYRDDIGAKGLIRWPQVHVDTGAMLG